MPKNLGSSLETFAEERRNLQNGESPAVPFHTTIPRKNAPTFESLYEVVTNGQDKDKRTVLKATISVLQCLIIAYEAGRKVDLQRELMKVPVSRAEINGSFITDTKSMLADRLTADIDCPQTIEF